AIYRIETRRRGTGHVKIAARPERHMVRGDRRFERSENEDLSCRADLENRAAAVADVEVALLVECQAGGDSHALDENRHVAIGRYLVHDPVHPAADVKRSLTVERQAGGVHHVCDKRPDVVVEVDLVNSDRNLLAARTAESRENVAETID